MAGGCTMTLTMLITLRIESLSREMVLEGSGKGTS